MHGKTPARATGDDDRGGTDQMRRLSEQLWRIEDSCAVYVVTGGSATVCIDFGTGRALEQPALREAWEQAVVLVTHHHRDQVQGLPQAIAAGARAWVPHTERDLFAAVDDHWQSRAVLNDYNVRQDRYSLLEPIPVAGTLRDYATYRFGGTEFLVVPTPGHTVGSLSLLAEIDGRRVAFTGDLIAAPGKVWSLAATQWTYNGGEGLAATILALLDLKERRPDLLLPSHGEPIEDVGAAIDRTVDGLWDLIRARRQANPRLFILRDQPYERVTEHLLWNRTSLAYSYVLLSRSGKALLFDFGYDFTVGLAAGNDRAARRPWLYTLPALKAQFGVREISAVIPTHYHDDHVAGLNLLRDVEGAQVWAAENFADILTRPLDYNLPCLWYEPIPVDRRLPLDTPFAWEEYELTLHPLPGHTKYAVAISFVVDEQRVIVAGDQYQGNDGTLWNYVYRNGFALDDYRASAALYRRISPSLILAGHTEPVVAQPGFFAMLEADGEALARLHRALLPDAAIDGGPEGELVRIRPYQAEVAAGTPLDLRLTIRNPLGRSACAELQLAAPREWEVSPAAMTISLPAAGEVERSLRVIPHGPPTRRVRLAVDCTIEGKPLGQQAECLVSVSDSPHPAAAAG
jgi:glyoxylase-like metal-dependent hydrolase (beta-lactamase superfamily II)